MYAVCKQSVCKQSFLKVIYTDQHVHVTLNCDRQDYEIEMTDCEPYMMSKFGGHGEPGIGPNLETSQQESARVYETPNLPSVYEQI